MEAQKIRFKGKAYHKGEWWTGFYIYSSYEKKHYIVQDAIETGQKNGSVSFAHFAEVDPSTLEVLVNGD